jgi:hypothetical protein
MENAFDREKVYSLRRTLVGRLQAASRGVSRRARFQAHQEFVREWERCRQEAKWGALSAALQAPGPGTEGGDLLFRLARGFGLSGEPLAMGRAVLASSDLEVRLSGFPARQASRDVVTRVDGKKGYQGELFGAELALQPL